MADEPSKDRILQVALDMIARDGASALSMRDVARRAGVSHQAPYHYFQNREAILASLAEDGFRILIAGVSAAEGADAITRLLAAGRVYVHVALSHRAHFAVMFSPDVVDLRHHPSALAEAQRAYAQLEGLVGDLVREGTVPRQRAEGLLLVVWSFIHGLCRLLADGSLPRQRTTDRGSSDVELALGAFGDLLRRFVPQAGGSAREASRTRRPSTRVSTRRKAVE